MLELALAADAAAIIAYIVAAVAFRTAPNPRNAIAAMTISTFALALVSVEAGLSVSLATLGMYALRRIHYRRLRTRNAA